MATTVSALSKRIAAVEEAESEAAVAAFEEMIHSWERIDRETWNQVREALLEGTDPDRARTSQEPAYKPGDRGGFFWRLYAHVISAAESRMPVNDFRQGLKALANERDLVRRDAAD